MSSTERPYSPLREARLQFRENQLDPERKLDPRERRQRALELDRAFFKGIGEASGRARRQKAAQLAALERAAIARAAATGEPVAAS
jgi:hypothetical protein